MSYLIEDYVRLNSLFDLYQPLLTHKQQDYFKYYFREDYSLSEIAEIMNVSRNAVHLQIKKISSYLEDYENKLKLLKKQEKRETLLDELLNDSSLSDGHKEKISKLEKV
ncbi:MAG: YlxM family DNA-binding protein [Candidatus Izemoplasmatales bacterium]